MCYVVEENQWADLEGPAWDGVSGKVLDKGMVRKARQEELDEYHTHRVYTKTDISECWKETGQSPVKVRWLDINKGDAENQY